jgi:hypothetical protein
MGMNFLIDNIIPPTSTLVAILDMVF